MRSNKITTPNFLELLKDLKDSRRKQEKMHSFVPQNFDFQILSADYSQIELRLMASFTKDKHMIY